MWAIGKVIVHFVPVSVLDLKMAPTCLALRPLRRTCAERGFKTPPGPSRIASKKVIRPNLKTDVEPQPAPIAKCEPYDNQEEFYFQGLAPKLDMIKRKLVFEDQDKSHTFTRTRRTHKVTHSRRGTKPTHISFQVGPDFQTSPVKQAMSFDSSRVASGEVVRAYEALKIEHQTGMRTDFASDTETVKSAKRKAGTTVTSATDTSKLETNSKLPPAAKRRKVELADDVMKSKSVAKVLSLAERSRKKARTSEAPQIIGPLIQQDKWVEGFQAWKRKKIRLNLAKGESLPCLGASSNDWPSSAGMELPLSLVKSCKAEARLGTNSGSLDIIATRSGPFPNYTRPLPDECRGVTDLLSDLHGHLAEYAQHRTCPTVDVLPSVSRDPECFEDLEFSGDHCADDLCISTSTGNAAIGTSEEVAVSTRHNMEVAQMTGHPRERRTVLDSLIGTILSQNTTDTNSRRAFAALKTAFPTWEEVHVAECKEVENAIRCGGLAEKKAERIHSILDSLLKERGKICLEYIYSMSSEEVKQELSRFKGVGPKTVACVLMFHLKRAEFPVDTHVWRISKMLGWVPPNANREKTYEHLNLRIPDDVKFDLHCLLVTHGKRCPQCAKRRAQQPADGPCPLVNWSSRLTKEKHRTESLVYK